MLIVGCVVGALALLAVASCLVVCCARLCRRRLRRRRRAKSVPPAPRTVRDDCIRPRPKPAFPGISMASDGDGQALTTSAPPPPALPISPTYGRPERLDLLSAEYDRSCDDLQTFERRRNGDSGVNGCS